VRRLVLFITHSAAPIGHSAQKSLVPELMQPFEQLSASTKLPLLQAWRVAPDEEHCDSPTLQ
jgi:hypothetical protein